MTAKDKNTQKKSALNIIGLFAGPVLYLIFLFGIHIEGLSRSGHAVVGVLILMIVWWFTEAVPLAVTGLLPLILFPLTSIMTEKATVAAYASDIFFLFLGGFIIAIAIEKWNLHHRISLQIVKVFGERPAYIVLGFMLASAFLTMWISNAATAIMMVAVALPVVKEFYTITKKSSKGKSLAAATAGKDFPFGKALLLGVGYAATIGGMATLIGTIPNAVMAGTAKAVFNQDVSFFTWLKIGLPVSIIGLLVLWLILTRFAFPLGNQRFSGIKKYIEIQQKKQGKMSGSELRVLSIFCVVAVLWIFRGIFSDLLTKWGLGIITDASIAIFGAVLLFAIPVSLKKREFLLNGDDLTKVSWGILIMFSGGLALAQGIEVTGVARWLVDQVGFLSGLPPFWILAIIVIVIIFLSEVMSNTAIAIMFLPVVAELAPLVGLDPFVLMFGVTLAASAAFMLPIGTPPNAIIYSTNYISMRQMMTVGLWLNIVFWIIITLFCYFCVPLIFP